MNAITRTITHALEVTSNAFKAFPVAILNAFAFAIVTIIRIQLDWPAQEPYNFLFNCLHWSFAFAAVFSLAAITASLSMSGEKRSFMTANFLGLAVAAVAFILLYYFGEANPDPFVSRYAVLSTLAVSRVAVATLISFLAFIILAGLSKDKSDIPGSLFMTQKAFFIALLYGVVIMAGLSGVAVAVQALLYNGMSSKVYMYIGTATGFLAFTIFVGYFPDFRKNSVDHHREVAQKQPRFIEVLFGYIMIPIILALTAVLLIWAAKTLFSGMSSSSFVRLASIASSFTIVGIWLHIMVAHHRTGLAEFYRKIYPIAALVILAFEAWALYVQLQAWGMKTTEYSFILLWILTAVAAVLLIIAKNKAYIAILSLTCVMALIWALPVIGAHALPVSIQSDRLENMLTDGGMLKAGELTPVASAPDRQVREAITDSVMFLTYSESSKLPAWFDKNLAQSDVFKTKLGFDQTWPEPVDIGSPNEFISLSLALPPEAVDISDYRWAVTLRDSYQKENGQIILKGEKGVYRIYWIDNSTQGIPTLKIMLDDRILIEHDLNEFIDQTTEKYPPGKEANHNPTFEDMSIKIETPELSALLVLRDVNINIDPQNDTINYWINPDALYLNER